MKDAIQTIANAGLRDQVKILIGDGPVDQACADYVGADYYCKTAQAGVVAAKKVSWTWARWLSWETKN